MPEGHIHRVLLIEDEEGIRSILDEALREEGYDVVAAAHGGEGLRLTLESPPCAVLVDLMLPVMDGVQYIEACRSRSQLDGLPIIAMSARHREEAAARLHVEGFLAKPFDLHELLAIVSTLLGRPQQAPPAKPARRRKKPPEKAGA